jgi:hypothetical protein
MSLLRKHWSTWGFSLTLTLIGCAGFLVSGQLRSPIGWAINLASQVLWLLYAIKFKQYGFILGCLFYGAVYLANLVAWLR